jgi:hypothetical protein
MKQTAVEWLIEQLYLSQGYESAIEILEQAKEMERQQIIDAYQNGGIHGQIFALTRETNIENGEQYYNETFKPQ